MIWGYSLGLLLGIVFGMSIATLILRIPKTCKLEPVPEPESEEQRLGRETFSDARDDVWEIDLYQHRVSIDDGCGTDVLEIPVESVNLLINSLLATWLQAARKGLLVEKEKQDG